VGRLEDSSKSRSSSVPFAVSWLNRCSNGTRREGVQAASGLPPVDLKDRPCWATVSGVKRCRMSFALHHV
jgi:hypothetical protein